MLDGGGVREAGVVEAPVVAEFSFFIEDEYVRSGEAAVGTGGELLFPVIEKRESPFVVFGVAFLVGEGLVVIGVPEFVGA